VIVYITKFL